MTIIYKLDVTHDTYRDSFEEHFTIGKEYKIIRQDSNYYYIVDNLNKEHQLSYCFMKRNFLNGRLLKLKKLKSEER
jgi:hypothetical protein